MYLFPLALLALAPAAPDSPSLADRAAAIVAQKAKMPNRYALKIRVESRVPNAPPPLESEWSSTLQIWRDGKKVRVDHFDARYTPPRPNHDPRDRHISCEDCERDGYGIVTTVVPGTPPTHHMVEFKRLGTWNFDYYCTGFDWRYFGLSNDGLCDYPGLHIATDFPKFFGLPAIVTRLDNRGVLPCLVASRKVALNNVEWSVWLSERDGLNPVFFENKFEVMAKPESRTTELSWQQTAGGHLFPKRVKHNTMISTNGSKYPLEEVVTITHADFDSPIDPAVFTVAGFGLNENQVIGYPELDHQKQPRWRNGQVDYSETAGKQTLVAVNAGAAPPAAAPYPTENNLSLIVGTVAGALAIGTAIIALVIRRNRRVAT